MRHVVPVLAVVLAVVAASAAPTRAQGAAFCPPGQAPAFRFGFAALEAQLGDVMGAAVSCEYGDPKGSGDTLQQTSTGLAFYRQRTNTPTFTNGFEHWALTPDGLVTWTGDSIDPPDAAAAAPSETPAANASTLAAVVTRVVDGDTVDVRLSTGEARRLRVLGIDTPETVDPAEPVGCYGPEASQQARRLLDGQAVSLRPDTTQDQVDRYGRLLVYVTLSDGGDFGEAMIREGYAREYTYQRPYERQAAYRAAEAEARAAGRGLWGACESTPAPTPAPPPEPGAGYSGPYDPAGPDRDCADFRTQREAQAFFEEAARVTGLRDRHRLDVDGDGVACETLP